MGGLFPTSTLERENPTEEIMRSSGLKEQSKPMVGKTRCTGPETMARETKENK